MISHRIPRILKSILSPKNHSSLNSHSHTFTIQPVEKIFQNYAKSRLTGLKMVRKSARGAKSKWPCGNCGFQCNDDAIFCEDCGRWYHVKCENLSSNDFTVLRQLTEEYLCSSCTHTGGEFSYDRALLRLRVCVSNGTLESGVKLESILLRNTPTVQVRTDELFLGSKAVDAVACGILKRTGEYIVHLLDKYYIV